MNARWHGRRRGGRNALATADARVGRSGVPSKGPRAHARDRRRPTRRSSDGRGPRLGTSVPGRLPGLPALPDGLTRASTPGRARDPTGPCPARTPGAHARPATTGGPVGLRPPATRERRGALGLSAGAPAGPCDGVRGRLRMGASPRIPVGASLPAPRRPGAACRRPRPRHAGSRRRPVRPRAGRLTPAERGSYDAPRARPCGPRGRATSVALDLWAACGKTGGRGGPGPPRLGAFPRRDPGSPRGNALRACPCGPRPRPRAHPLYRGPYIYPFSSATGLYGTFSRKWSLGTMP